MCQDDININQQVFNHWLFDNYKVTEGGNIMNKVVCTLIDFFSNDALAQDILIEEFKEKGLILFVKFIKLSQKYIDFYTYISSIKFVTSGLNKNYSDPSFDYTDDKYVDTFINLLKSNKKAEISELDEVRELSGFGRFRGFEDNPNQFQSITDEKIDELYNSYIRVLYEAISDKDNELYYGFSFSNHAVGFYFKKISEDEIIFYLINSGDGANYQFIQPDIQHNYGIMGWKISGENNITKFKRFLTICFIFEELIDVNILYFCLLRNLLLENYSGDDRYLYYNQYKNLYKGIKMPLQIIGNCTLNSIVYLLEILFREDDEIDEINQSNKFSDLSQNFKNFYNMIKLLILRNKVVFLTNETEKKDFKFKGEFMADLECLKEQFVLLDEIPEIKDSASYFLEIISKNLNNLYIKKNIYIENYNIINNFDCEEFNNNMVYDLNKKIEIDIQPLEYGKDTFKQISEEIKNYFVIFDKIVNQEKDFDKINKLINTLANIAMLIINLNSKYENYQYQRVNFKLFGQKISKLYEYIKNNISEINIQDEYLITYNLYGIFMTYNSLNKFFYKSGFSDNYINKDNLNGSGYGEYYITTSYLEERIITTSDSIPLLQIIIITGIFYDKLNEHNKHLRISSHSEDVTYKSVKLLICNFKIKTQEDVKRLKSLEDDLLERGYFKYFGSILEFNDNFLNVVSRNKSPKIDVNFFLGGSNGYNFIDNTTELITESQYSYFNFYKSHSRFDKIFNNEDSDYSPNNYQIKTETCKYYNIDNYANMITSYFKTSHYSNIFDFDEIKSCTNFINNFNSNINTPSSLNWLLLSLNLNFFGARFISENLTKELFNENIDIVNRLKNLDFTSEISFLGFIDINFNNPTLKKRAIKPEELIIYINNFLILKSELYKEPYFIKYFYYGFSDSTHNNELSYKDIFYSENNFNYSMENIDLNVFNNFLCEIKNGIFILNDKTNFSHYHNILVNIYMFTILEKRFDNIKKMLVDFILEVKNIFNSVAMNTILYIEKRIDLDINMLIQKYLLIIKIRYLLDYNTAPNITSLINYDELNDNQFVNLIFFDLLIEYIIKNNIKYDEYLGAKTYLTNYNISTITEHKFNDDEISNIQNNRVIFYNTDEYINLITKLCNIRFLEKVNNIILVDKENNDCVIVFNYFNKLPNKIQSFYINFDKILEQTNKEKIYSGQILSRHTYSGNESPMTLLRQIEMIGGMDENYLESYFENPQKYAPQIEDVDEVEPIIENIPSYLNIENEQIYSEFIQEHQNSQGDTLLKIVRKNLTKNIYKFDKFGVELEFKNQKGTLYPEMLVLRGITISSNVAKNKEKYKNISLNYKHEINYKTNYKHSYNSYLQTVFTSDYSLINNLDWGLIHKNKDLHNIKSDDIIIQSYKACSKNDSFTIDFYLNHYEIKINKFNILTIFDLFNHTAYYNKKLIEIYCKLINFLNLNNEDRKSTVSGNDLRIYDKEKYFNELIPIKISDTKICFKCFELNIEFIYDIEKSILQYNNYEIITNNKIPYLINKYITNTNLFLVRKNNSDIFEYMGAYYNNNLSCTEIFIFNLDYNGIQNLKDDNKLIIILKSLLNSGNFVEADEILSNIIKNKYINNGLVINDYSEIFYENLQNSDITLDGFLDYNKVYTLYFGIILNQLGFKIFKYCALKKIGSEYDNLIESDLVYFNKFGYKNLTKNSFIMNNSSSGISLNNIFYKGQLNLQPEKYEINYNKTLTFLLINKYNNINTILSPIIKEELITFSSELYNFYVNDNTYKSNTIYLTTKPEKKLPELNNITVSKSKYNIKITELIKYLNINDNKNNYIPEEVLNKEFNEDYQIYLENLNKSNNYYITIENFQELIKVLKELKNELFEEYCNTNYLLFNARKFNFRVTDFILFNDMENSSVYKELIQIYIIYKKTLSLLSIVESINELLDEKNKKPIDANLVYEMIIQEPVYIDKTMSAYILAFEFIVGYNIRQIQYDYILEFKKELLLEKPQNIHQFLMGQGKSTVIAPLLTILILQENGEFFEKENIKIFQVMPETLVKQSKNIFANIFYNLNYITLFSQIEIYSDYKLKLETLNNIPNPKSKKYFYLYDEIDEIADPLKSQLNMILNSPVKIKNDSLTFKIIFDFMYNLYFNSEEKYEKIRKSLIKKSFKNTPHLILESDTITNEEIIIIKKVYYESINKNLSTNYSEILEKIITKQDYDSENINLEILNMLNNFYNIIPIILQQLHRRHFGYKFTDKNILSMTSLSNFIHNNEKYKDLFLAIPYDALEKPSEKSEYTDHLYIIAITIICYYDNVVNRVRTIDIQLYLEYIKNIYFSQTFMNLEDNIGYKYFKELTKGIKTENLPNIKKTLSIIEFKSDDIKIITRNFPIRRYLLKVIFPKYIKVNNYIKNISCIDLLNSDFSKHRIGFTGTPFVSVPIEYNSKYPITDVIRQNGGNGEIVASIVGLQRKAKNELIKNGNDMINYAMSNGYHVIIDVGCYFVNVDNLAVAKLIHNNLKKNNSKINTVVFIDNNDGKKAINEFGNIVNYEEITEPLEKRFYYYDQAHITGIDMQIYSLAKGLISIAFFNRLRDVAQGIYRMRKINKGQTVDFCMDSKLYNHLEHKSIKLIDLLIKNELSYKKSQNNLFLKQNILTLYRVFFNSKRFNILENGEIETNSLNLDLNKPFDYLNSDIYNQPVSFDIVEKKYVNMDLMKFFCLEVVELLRKIDNKGLKSLLKKLLCGINLLNYTDAKTTAINETIQSHTQLSTEIQEDVNQNKEINMEIQKNMFSIVHSKISFGDTIININKYFLIDEFVLSKENSNIINGNGTLLFYKFIDKLFISNIYNYKSCVLEVFENRNTKSNYLNFSYSIMIDVTEATKILYYSLTNRLSEQYIFKIYTTNGILIYKNDFNKKLSYPYNYDLTKIIYSILGNNTCIRDDDFISILDKFYGFNFIGQLVLFKYNILPNINFNYESKYFILIGKLDFIQLFDCMIVIKIINECVESDNINNGYYFSKIYNQNNLLNLVNDVKEFIKINRDPELTKKYLGFINKLDKKYSLDEIINYLKIVLRFIFNLNLYTEEKSILQKSISLYNSLENFGGFKNEYSGYSGYSGYTVSKDPNKTESVVESEYLYAQEYNLINEIMKKQYIYKSYFYIIKNKFKDVKI